MLHPLCKPQKRQATANFQRINEAYNVLKDEGKRTMATGHSLSGLGDWVSGLGLRGMQQLIASRFTFHFASLPASIVRYYRHFFLISRSVLEPIQVLDGQAKGPLGHRTITATLSTYTQV